MNYSEQSPKEPTRDKIKTAKSASSNKKKLGDTEPNDDEAKNDSKTEISEEAEQSDQLNS